MPADKTSGIWNHFVSLTEKQAWCKYCTKTIATTDHSTGNLGRHLEACRPAMHREYMKTVLKKKREAKAKKRQIEMTHAEIEAAGFSTKRTKRTSFLEGETEDMESGTIGFEETYEAYSKGQVLFDLWLSQLLTEEKSFSPELISSSAFKKFLLKLNPKIKINPSHLYTENNMELMYNRMREDLRKILQNDMSQTNAVIYVPQLWINPKTLSSFLISRLHYKDESFRAKTVLLEMKKIGRSGRPYLAAMMDAHLKDVPGLDLTKTGKIILKPTSEYLSDACKQMQTARVIFEGVPVFIKRYWEATVNEFGNIKQMFEKMEAILFKMKTEPLYASIIFFKAQQERIKFPAWSLSREDQLRVFYKLSPILTVSNCHPRFPQEEAFTEEEHGLFMQLYEVLKEYEMLQNFLRRQVLLGNVPVALFNFSEFCLNKLAAENGVAKRFLQALSDNLRAEAGEAFNFNDEAIKLSSILHPYFKGDLQSNAEIYQVIDRSVELHHSTITFNEELAAESEVITQLNPAERRVAGTEAVSNRDRTPPLRRQFEEFMVFSEEISERGSVDVLKWWDSKKEIWPLLASVAGSSVSCPAHLDEVDLQAFDTDKETVIVNFCRANWDNVSRHNYSVSKEMLRIKREEEEEEEEGMETSQSLSSDSEPEHTGLTPAGPSSASTPIHSPPSSPSSLTMAPKRRRTAAILDDWASAATTSAASSSTTSTTTTTAGAGPSTTSTPTRAVGAGSSTTTTAAAGAARSSTATATAGADWLERGLAEARANVQADVARRAIEADAGRVTTSPAPSATTLTIATSPVSSATTPVTTSPAPTGPVPLGTTPVTTSPAATTGAPATSATILPDTTSRSPSTTTYPVAISPVPSATTSAAATSPTTSAVAPVTTSSTSTAPPTSSIWGEQGRPTWLASGIAEVRANLQAMASPLTTSTTTTAASPSTTSTTTTAAGAGPSTTSTTTTAAGAGPSTTSTTSARPTTTTAAALALATLSALAANQPARREQTRTEPIAPTRGENEPVSLGQIVELVDTTVPPTAATTSLFIHTDQPPPPGVDIEDINLGPAWDSGESDSLDSISID